MDSLFKVALHLLIQKLNIIHLNNILFSGSCEMLLVNKTITTQLFVIGRNFEVSLVHAPYPTYCILSIQLDKESTKWERHDYFYNRMFFTDYCNLMSVTTAVKLM